MIAMDDFEDPDDMSSGDKSEKLDDSQMEDIKFLEGVNFEGEMESEIDYLKNQFEIVSDSKVFQEGFGNEIRRILLIL